METELIDRYNALVSDSDSVLFLGDCFFAPYLVCKDILGKLKGNKYLLQGNHDKFKPKVYLEMGFLEVYPKYFKSTLGGIPIYYSHYPFSGYSVDKRFEERRPPQDRVIVHGHTHEKCKLTAKNTVHVGVDAWDYGPAPISEVIEIVKQANQVKYGK
jgi:calcineurin-like phosphoesterase family protein